MEKKYAYITLLTNDDYLYCLLGLYASYKASNSIYPFYCAVTKTVSKKTISIIHAVGIETIDIPLIQLNPLLQRNNIVHHMPLTFQAAMSKLAILSLPFDKIVYLDSDILINQNIDDLFEYSHMSAVVDVDYLKPDTPDWEVKGDRWFRYFNAGMLVLEPKPDLSKEILDFTNNLPYDRAWNDQNILAAYYRNWDNMYEKHLPVYYNLLMEYIDIYNRFPWFDTNQIRIMHFIYYYKPVPKLWPTKKLITSIRKPLLKQSVIAYFNIIDNFILEEKKLNHLPQDFPLISELENVNAK